MAARKRKVALTDDWKANIQATQIMNRLYGHMLGEVQLEKTQIDCAKIILAKILPDLKAIESTIEHKGAVGVLTGDQAAAIAKAFIDGSNKPTES